MIDVNVPEKWVLDMIECGCFFTVSEGVGFARKRDVCVDKFAYIDNWQSFFRGDGNEVVFAGGLGRTWLNIGCFSG